MAKNSDHYQKSMPPASAPAASASVAPVPAAPAPAVPALAASAPAASAATAPRSEAQTAPASLLDLAQTAGGLAQAAALDAAGWDSLDNVALDSASPYVAGIGAVARAGGQSAVTRGDSAAARSAVDAGAGAANAGTAGVGVASAGTAGVGVASAGTAGVGAAEQSAAIGGSDPTTAATEAAVLGDLSQAQLQRLTTRTQSTEGFRLDRVDVYNWGSFNNNVKTVYLGGQNVLMTGDNGAGKSSIIDAITVLLYDVKKVVFNQAAGAEKGERNLASYVLGLYKNDNTSGVKTELGLRSKDKAVLSIIMASFYNKALNEHVVLDRKSVV